MPAELSPPRQVRQEVWDAAAALADQGRALPSIVSEVMEVAGPQIEAQSVLEIAPHGRTFWFSLAKAFAWGLAADIGLLVAESVGARPVPALKIAIYLGVLVWSLVFGVVAANNKVRQRRTRVSIQNRALIERLAQDAARYVWAAEVPGDWEPLGPAPHGRSAKDGTVPDAWLSRFGLARGQARAVITDGSDESLRRALRDASGGPVVAFTREPGAFSPTARRLADDAGVAAFVIAGGELTAASGPAVRTLRAYRVGQGPVSPAQIILDGWAGSAPARAAGL